MKRNNQAVRLNAPKTISETETAKPLNINMHDVILELLYAETSMALEDIGLNLKIDDINMLKYLLESSPDVEKMGTNENARYRLSLIYPKANEAIMYQPLPYDTLQNRIENFLEFEKIEDDVITRKSYTLLVVKIRKFYRRDYDTFEKFCLAVFGFTEEHATRLIKACIFQRNMASILGGKFPLPELEAQLRVLRSFSNLELAVKVYVNSYLELRKQPTVSQLKATKDKLLGIKPPNTPPSNVANEEKKQVFCSIFDTC